MPSNKRKPAAGRSASSSTSSRAPLARSAIKSRLRGLIERTGSKAAAARKLGVSRSTVSRWARGRLTERAQTRASQTIRKPARVRKPAPVRKPTPARKPTPIHKPAPVRKPPRGRARGRTIRKAIEKVFKRKPAPRKPIRKPAPSRKPRKPIRKRRPSARLQFEKRQDIVRRGPRGEVLEKVGIREIYTTKRLPDRSPDPDADAFVLVAEDEDGNYWGTTEFDSWDGAVSDIEDKDERYEAVLIYHVMLIYDLHG